MVCYKSLGFSFFQINANTIANKHILKENESTHALKRTMFGSVDYFGKGCKYFSFYCVNTCH